MPQDPEELLRRKDTIAHLESIVRGFVEALERRDMDPKSAPWQHMSDAFVASPDFPVEQSGSVHIARDLSLTEWLRSMDQYMNERYGRSHDATVLSMSTQLQQKKAEVFAATQARSMDDRMDRSTVDHQATMLHFVWDQGRARWLCTKFVALSGLVGDGDALLGF